MPLVISRHKGETIQIGDEVKIEITETRGDRCKVAIHAPADVKVWRGELVERKEAKP